MTTTFLISFLHEIIQREVGYLIIFAENYLAVPTYGFSVPK
jgi:hypothetical protein